MAKCCEFELSDGCVAYKDWQPSLRRVILRQANLSLRSGWQQVPFLGEIHEGSKFAFEKKRRDDIRPEDAESVAGRRAYTHTWHPPERVGLVVEISMDNLWHVLFHAIPVRQLFLRRKLHLASVDFLPRYTQNWPDDQSLALQDSSLRPVQQWVGWEMLMRRSAIPTSLACCFA